METVGKALGRRRIQLILRLAAERHSVCMKFTTAKQLLDALLEDDRLSASDLDSVLRELEEGQYLDYKDGRITHRSSLPYELEGASSDSPSWLLHKVLASRCTLLARIVDLSEAAHLLLAEHPVGAAILARSVLETTSVLVKLQEVISEFSPQGKETELEEAVEKLLLGSRRTGTTVEATNILSQIDRMVKLFNETQLRDMYDELSEISHPNAAGVIVSYGRLDKDASSLKIGTDESNRPAEIAVVVIAIALRISLLSGAKIDSALRPL